MYSGTSLTNHSGNWFGVHQKINRTARRALAELVSVSNFPSLKSIQHFEGKNGPDGIKVKSPAVDEPWHYYDPYDPEDDGLIKLIADHYEGLVQLVKDKNIDKAAFEAAWLSHALVDGLTPAHHFPYEEKLEELRGEGKETRVTIKEKLVLKGENKRDTAKKNWRMWGAKGLFTTHALFEAGVAATLAPNKIRQGYPSEEEIAKAHKLGLVEYFMQAAREIAALDMYERFYRKGWTVQLASETRNTLAPIIAKTVTIAWFLALKEAGMANKKHTKDHVKPKFVPKAKIKLHKTRK